MVKIEYLYINYIEMKAEENQIIVCYLAIIRTWQKIESFIKKKV